MKWHCRLYIAALLNSAFESVVFNRGQKMALRAFYFIRALAKALICYYIIRSQRHLLVAFKDNRFGGPIELSGEMQIKDHHF